MGKSRRWKEFISWWREIEPNGHLYPPENLTRLITMKIDEIIGKYENKKRKKE